MPIYDYLCTECDHRADILHGINDPGPNFCPSCGKEGTMRKQFVAPTIHFKGSGWAKKDRGASASTKAARSAADKPEDKAERKDDKAERKDDKAERKDDKAERKDDQRHEARSEPMNETKPSGSGSSSGGSSASSTD